MTYCRCYRAATLCPLTGEKNLNQTHTHTHTLELGFESARPGTEILISVPGLIVTNPLTRVCVCVCVCVRLSTEGAECGGSVASAVIDTAGADCLASL